MRESESGRLLSESIKMWTTLKFRAAKNGVMHKMHRVTQLQFKGFDTKAVGSARRAKIALDLMGIKSAGPVPMPRQRTLYAFLKSPFKWKKHQELWETRVYTRILTFEADVLTTRKCAPHRFPASPRLVSVLGPHVPLFFHLFLSFCVHIDKDLKSYLSLKRVSHGEGGEEIHSRPKV